MKLYELPRDKGVKIYGLKSVDGEDVTIVFGHLDGMYSYCWVEDENGDTNKIVHLAASTPIEPYKDGYKVKEE